MEGMTDAERPASMRIGRVAAELKVRRRRLDVYQQSSDWPGKEPAWRWELSRYDHSCSPATVPAWLAFTAAPMTRWARLPPDR